MLPHIQTSSNAVTLHEIPSTILLALRRGRLPPDHEIHGREQPPPAALHERICCLAKTLGCLPGAARRKPQRLHDAEHVVRDDPPPLVHPRYSEQVPEGLRVPEVAGQRPVPRRSVEVGGRSGRTGRGSEVLVVLEVETGILDGCDAVFPVEHAGDAVSLLDSKTNAAVVEVVVIVGIRHQPLVDTEDAAGLEDAEDLGVDALEGGGVAGRLDSVDSVEGVVGEWDILCQVSHIQYYHSPNQSR